MNNNAFVFVVCGKKEHIDTLHFSLAALKRISEDPIYIVTDNKRNEIPIQHNEIINIDTPEEFDHHQASIFLKTGLHKFLPLNNTYCYLDSDVIAISKECNLIFNEFISPIIFAPDHCRLRKFSPSAINCGCLEKWDLEWLQLDAALDKHDKNRQIHDAETLDKVNSLKKNFDRLEHQFIKKWLLAIRFLLSPETFKLNDEFFYDKKINCWKDNRGNIILFEINNKAIENETNLKYDKINHRWVNSKGEDIWKRECNHLREQISADFGLTIAEKDWQHWNGGVFLFNDSSHEFLESWHQKTLQIFKLKKWKTRDQGTLIATAWEFGLQRHPVLNKKWNFIADYNILGLDFNEAGEFTDDHWKSKCQPAFIHIYHHFGDDKWNMLNYVKNKLTVT